MEEGSSSYSTKTTRQTTTKQLSESLYELHKPRGEPSVQIIFFHGFQVEQGSDPHLSTWRSGNDIWPQTWLVDEFSNAHVFTVAYKAELLCNSKGGKVDMYIIVENILSDLLQEKIGQNPRCPIVLVGHSLGGLVIKDICLQAHNRRTSEHETFLSAVKGFFFYSTPHHGIPNVGAIARFLSDSPLLDYVETLSKPTARMNDEFEKLVKKHGWQIAGVGENLPTKLSPFLAFVVVPEASARYGDFFNVVTTADHITVCKPITKYFTSFKRLTELLHNLSISSEQKTPAGNYQHLSPKFVGREDTLDTLKIKLLEASSLGLAGMGGIGKSTLARALFNVLESQYEYTCFIRDVKNVTESEDIQSAFILRLHHWGKLMGKRKEDDLWFLTGKRLLLILDDVASEEKDLAIVEMLQHTIGTHRESRFVATSRDSNLLERCLDELHITDLLSLDVSIELFVSHAFPKAAPPSFVGYVGDIAQKCGQLPLALEVMGKHLKGKPESVWQEAQIALSNRSTLHGLPEQLMSSLQTSYDGLVGEEKRMFLDTALVFYNMPLDKVKMMWTMPMKETFWLHLVDLSLVWVLEDDDKVRVGMHEQLRTLARQISSTPGGGGQRIWYYEKAWEALLGIGFSSDDEKDIVALNLKTTGILSRDIQDGIMALQQEVRFNFVESVMKHVLECCGDLDSPPGDRLAKPFLQGTYDESNTARERTDGVCIPGSILCKLSNLQYLRLDGVDVDDNSGDELPSALVYLVWMNTRSTRLPFNPSSHKRMAVLDLGSLHLCTLPSNFGQLSGLQSLRISCPVKSLPDSFGQLLCLRELTLFDCEFVKLPETFGELKNLKILRFNKANKLKALPQSFGDLSELYELRLRDCVELEALPVSFGRLRNLKKLSFTGAEKLKALPWSFGDLSELKLLQLDHCYQLEELPDSFGRLRNLKQLEFGRASKLKALPWSFGDLSELESLQLNGCLELRSLPNSFGRLRNLKKLKFGGARKLKALPQSFGDLSELESLELMDCVELEALPDSFGRLRNLKQLIFFRAGKLKALPQSFGDLSELESLELARCSVLEALPDSFGGLRNLKKLKFNGARKLKALPQSFGDLSGLESLELSRCYVLEALPDSFGGLRNLKKLKFHGAKKLKALPHSFGDLSKLESMELIGCTKLDALPDSFGGLRNLKKLNFDGAVKVKALPRSFGDLSGLESLKLHYLSELETLPDSFTRLSKLRMFSIWSLLKLKILPDTFGDLAALEELNVDNCVALSTLPDSCGSLATLKRLSIKNCNSLSALANSLGRLPTLESVQIEDCATLDELPESLRRFNQ